ncbi:MAG: LysM peptidoglycan-binding domain-containing protein [Parasphingorhabdus sp.]|nr:LysM peptidoglycan-binding domain-containing protein [Parasphingorhabdus sp.]
MVEHVGNRAAIASTSNALHGVHIQAQKSSTDAAHIANQAKIAAAPARFVANTVEHLRQNNLVQPEALSGLASTLLGRLREDQALNAIRPVPGGAVAEGQALRELDNMAAGIPALSTAKGILSRYTVQSGDTLNSIAAKFEISYSDLLRANPRIDPTANLLVGQSLNVPVNNAVIVVVAGDTVSGLAARYGVSENVIRSANNIGTDNVIKVGQRLRIIPAIEVGLATTGNVRAYLNDIATLKTPPAAGAGPMTAAEKLAIYQTAIDNRFAALGIPAPTVVMGAAGLGAGAQYDFTTHRLEIGPDALNADLTDPANFTNTANTVYHEARHAEQWYNMARVMASEQPTGSTPAQIAATIATDMAIPLNIATLAAANPLQRGTVSGNYFGAMLDNVYGAGATNRNAVLTDLSAPGGFTQAQYDAYRSLPEEADAWRVGGKVTVLSQQ